MDANWWNNALQSYDVGREHRADRENAQAFQTGGYGAVEQAAGNRGDMQTAMTTRRFQDDDRQRAYDRMETIAPRARGLIRAARNMANQNPEQARQFLGGYANMFTDFGFTPEQVQAGIAGLTSENPEERTQWADTLDQAFQQHQDPNWQLATVPTENGQGVEQRAIAIDPANGAIQRGEGSIPVPRGEIQSFGSGGLYRENPNAPNGIEIIREPRSVAGGGGGGGYRPLTPEEADMYGIPNEGQGYTMGPNGRPARIPGSGGGRYTDSASAAAGYASRMASSNHTLTALEDTALDPAGAWTARAGFGNQEQRQVRQAQREFVNAVLRRESGAVISDTEFASASQQYFPQPGDGAAVVEQKRAARQRALQGVINASQGAYEEWYPDAPMTMTGPAQQGAGIGASVGAMIGARGANNAAPSGAAEEWVRDANGRLVPARR